MVTGKEAGLEAQEAGSGQGLCCCGEGTETELVRSRLEASEGLSYVGDEFSRQAGEMSRPCSSEPQEVG